MRKGQGRIPLLDACGLRALRRHCITHRHDAVIDITKRAQEYFQKPLLVTQSTVPSGDATKALSCKKEAICEHGPEAPSCPVGQGSFKMDCFKVFYGQTSPNLTFYLEITDAVSSGQRGGDLPGCYQRSVKSQHL